MKRSFGEKHRIANKARKATSERKKLYYNLYYYIYDY